MREARTADSALGHRIREARKKAGLTMVQLAARIGVSHGAISQFENAKSGIGLETIKRIAEATGTELPELLGGEPGAIYMDGDAGDGFLGPDQSSWPESMKGEVPVYWPGTLRGFVGSSAAEMARLGPDEVGWLARMGVEKQAPVTDAGWIMLLSIGRILYGGRGRPVLLEMVKTAGEEDDDNAGG